VSFVQVSSMKSGVLGVSSRYCVLQYVAVFCGVLQSVFQCAALCCSVLQCVAVCCRVCFSVCRSMLQLHIDGPGNGLNPVVASCVFVCVFVFVFVCVCVCVYVHVSVFVCVSHTHQ